MTLVEREQQLGPLQQMLAGVAAGGGRVVLLGGEAGIGKTSLLEALAAVRGKASLWWGACDALQTPHPLAPLQDIARVAPVSFGHRLASELDRPALFEAVLAELQQSRQPVMFVVEDAHWADDATLDLLKFVGRRIQSAPCLLLVSYRDDEVDARHPLRRLMGELPARTTLRLELPRLSPAAVEQLARGALRDPAGIHAITQGNPFFVSELLRQDVRGVPRGVQDLVLSRSSRLGTEAQDLVGLVSLVPARAERWLVQAVAAPSPQALEEALNSGLLVATATHLSFRHELARAAIESSLSPAVSQAWHAAMLAALEAEAAPSATHARRVHHAVHAGDAAAVLRLAPEAARQARARGAHKEAAAQLRTALDFADREPAAVRAGLEDELSYEYYLTDRIAEAVAARERALALWQAVGDRVREGDTLRWLSRLNWYNGRSAQADTYARQAIALLEALPAGRELAMAYSNQSQLHMLAGRDDEAVAWGRKALALSLEQGHEDIRIHALNNIGSARLDAGDAGGRLELEESLALALAGGHEEHAARAFTNLAYSAQAYRDAAWLDEVLERGIAYCEARDLDSWARYMQGYRSERLLTRGQWDAAAEQAEIILRSPCSAPISRIPALAVLARLRARRGDPDPDSLLAEAWQLARPMQTLMRLGPVACAMAEVAWLRGDAAGALPALREAAALPVGGCNAYWIHGEVVFWLWRATGEPPPAAALPAPIARQIAGDWRAAAEAWDALGHVLEAARARAEGDEAAMREALSLFDALGARADAEALRRRLHAAGVRGLPRGQRASTRANPHELTARELEVLRLLCEGLRNAQIAERLHRSVRTVDHHLAAAFAKLGVGSRAEAIAAAHAGGLWPAK